MEAVLRNFKNIPCPRGDSCAQPGCQWYHTLDSHKNGGLGGGDGAEDGVVVDDDAQQGRAAQEPEGPAQQPQRPPPSSTPPPLKKRKAATLPPDKATAAKRLAMPSHPVSAKTASTSADSPALPKAPPPMSSATTTTTTTTTTSQDSKNKNESSKVSAAPARKPETLNPRLLKSAPAPHDFRYKVLKMLHEQFVRLNSEVKKSSDAKDRKLVLSEQELIWLALDEEQRVATDRAPIYSNVIKNRVMTYRRMAPDKWKEERLAEYKKLQAKKSGHGTGTHKPVEPAVIHTGLTPQQELQFVRDHLVTPITELSLHGYVSVPPSEQEIAQARAGVEFSAGWEICDRCSTRFQVFPGRRESDGALAAGGKCTFHYGKPYYLARDGTGRGDGLKRLRCCKEAVGDSPGCVTAPTHVFKTTDPKRLAAVVPFAVTPSNPAAPRDRAVAFDCEMGYTSHGMELIRLTATSWPDGAALLDVLVHPVGEILDLNSRYSGVTPEDFANAEPWTADSKYEPAPPAAPDRDGDEDGEIEEAPPKKQKLQIVSSPVVARDLLFRLLAPDTPLVGHGLENDLNAARVVHPTVVDTVLLFPHARGLPFRHGLRMLMEKRLGRQIQQESDAAGNAVVGHDSAEDARAAGDLVRLKVQEEWYKMRELKGWRLGEGGEFVPPPGKAAVARRGRLTEEFIEGTGGDEEGQGAG